MCEMKESYKNCEWLEREEYYKNNLLQLNIPTLPTNDEVLTLISKIDAIMTEATFECAILERKHEKAMLDLKNAETEMFGILKKQQLASGEKITEADTKSLVKTYLNNNPVGGFKKDIYSVIKATIDRYTYMKAVVKILSEKKNSIISILGVLKIESSMSNTVKGEN